MGICSDGTILFDSTSNGGWVKSGSVSGSLDDSRVLLLVACRGLIRIGVFSVESFERFLQEDPCYFKGIPLGDEEFMFDISFHAARDVAESKVSHLSECECVEYS